jgi:hypothetical protein
MWLAPDLPVFPHYDWTSPLYVTVINLSHEYNYPMCVNMGALATPAHDLYLPPIFCYPLSSIWPPYAIQLPSIPLH